MPPLSFGHFPRRAGETWPLGRPVHPHPSPLPSRERGYRRRPDPGIPCVRFAPRPLTLREGEGSALRRSPPNPLLKEGGTTSEVLAFELAAFYEVVEEVGVGF